MTGSQVLDRVDVEPADQDPFAPLSTAGLGWLVEHVAFLRRPSDWLTGYDDVLSDGVATWRQVGTTLGGIARQRAGEGWERATAFPDRLTGEIAAMSRICLGVASKVAAARTILAAVRDVFRDVISLFVAEVLRNATVALASSEVGAGGAVAEFAAWAVGRGAVVLDRITRPLSDLARVLTNALSALKALFAKARDVLEAISRYGEERTSTPGSRTFRHHPLARHRRADPRQ